MTRLQISIIKKTVPETETETVVRAQNERKSEQKINFPAATDQIPSSIGRIHKNSKRKHF